MSKCTVLIVINNNNVICNTNIFYRKKKKIVNQKDIDFLERQKNYLDLTLVFGNIDYYYCTPSITK